MREAGQKLGRPYSKKDTATDEPVEKGSFIQRTDDPGGETAHKRQAQSRSGKNEGRGQRLLDFTKYGLSST